MKILILLTLLYSSQAIGAVTFSDLSGKLIKVEKDTWLFKISRQYYGSNKYWKAIWFSTNLISMNNDEIRRIKDSNIIYEGDYIFIPNQETVAGIHDKYKSKIGGLYYWQLDERSHHFIRIHPQSKIALNALIGTPKGKEPVDIITKINGANKWLYPDEKPSRNASGTYEITGNVIEFDQELTKTGSIPKTRYKGVYEDNYLHLTEYSNGNIKHIKTNHGDALITPKYRSYIKVNNN